MSLLAERTASLAAAGAADDAAGSFRAAFERELAQAGAHTPQACMQAAALACREELARRWAHTQAADARRTTRRVHYLSMEFLIGRALRNALAALGVERELAQALQARGHSLAEVLDAEPDAALGNGGLGRLAACFLDAFAEGGLPSFGYGLRYRYGMFAQGLQQGRQHESPDDWMAQGASWEVPRPGLRYTVGFGGRVQAGPDGRRCWQPDEQLLAQAHDFIVPAQRGEHVSTLRQWHALSARSIDFAAFCNGDHEGAARHLLAADAINWVLYPDDSTDAGRVLRLKQEAFLVSASLQDLVARHLRETGSLQGLAQRNAIHLNDTHPALAPAELMRLLLDEHGLGWDEAWALTREATSYTNHTLMPEALETWPLRMFQALLPRHLEILFEINHRFLDELRQRFPGDEALLARASLIDESGERRVRMAALAVVASHKVNGVSALHSQLMVRTLFADYARLWPERFINVTNGVTPRRWLAQANPELGALLDRRIGAGWRRDLGELARLRPLCGDAGLGREFLAAKQAAKQRLAALVQRQLGLAVDPASLFDVQVKRIHEYKRQLLNLLHVVARWQAIVAQPDADWLPRTVVMAGKAASAYHTAKLVIQLANDIAHVVNADPRTAGRLKLVFLPNYGVSLAETIIPAADLSQQISTAGTEASGTGNMKFALNGALTIGTWDGANIEMAEAIGSDQLFVFGLHADDVQRMKSQGYDPRAFVDGNATLQQALQAVGGGAFSAGEPGRYRALVDGLLRDDAYMLMADFADYLAAQQRVDALYRDPAAWARTALRNIAGMGRFSVDRTVAEYAQQVWRAPR